MTPSDFFVSFWWLIFPIMWFVFAVLRMWSHHRRNQRGLDILKSYVDQGREPPPEVLRAACGQGDPHGGYAGAGAPGDMNAPGYGPGPGYNANWGGPWGAWGGPWGRRAYRYGPFWAWRRVFIFASLAIGFAAAAWYEGGGEEFRGFMVVAIIMGVLTVGSLLTAILQSMWKPK